MAKSNTIKIPEVMSPAGDFICLSAALQAGANAIYFGVKGSNMRAGAKNFELSDLPKIRKECDKFGAKAYITLNTIYYEGEQKKLAKILDAVKKAKIDAVIAWDYAVLSAAQERKIPVYLSTQASVSNSDAIVSYYKKFGITRFVLARECTLDSIKEIRKSLEKKLGAKAEKITLEVFAHGAMCVSMSGRCFMSEFVCGKSANRGECLQPCRREYLITDTAGSGAEFVVGKGFVMSPKDLCTLGFLDKLLDAGVASLKIEGRNRNAEYVYNTTKSYVTARNFYLENRRKKDFKETFDSLKKQLLEDLSKVFTRGFSNGFYMGMPLSDWTSGGNVATMRKTIVGRVTNYFSKISVAEITIDANTISEGEKIQFEGDSTGFFEMTAEGIISEGKAIKKAQKGDIITLKVPMKVRKSDRVYKLVKAK